MPIDFGSFGRLFRHLVFLEIRTTLRTTDAEVVPTLTTASFGQITVYMYSHVCWYVYHLCSSTLTLNWLGITSFEHKKYMRCNPNDISTCISQAELAFFKKNHYWLVALVPFDVSLSCNEDWHWSKERNNSWTNTFAFPITEDMHFGQIVTEKMKR